MKYIYACSNPSHTRKEVIHSMKEDPDVRCGECGEQMHRVPQAFTFYNNPGQTLINQLDEEHRQWRIAKSKGLPG